MRKLRKLSNLTQAELELLIKAFFYLGWIRATITLLPIRRIIKYLRFTEGENAVENSTAVLKQITLVRKTIQTASAYTPWKSTCLVQSLTEALLLRKYKIPSTLYLGVAKDREEPKRFSFHAWIRCAPTEEKKCEQFTIISSFTTLL